MSSINIPWTSTESAARSGEFGWSGIAVDALPEYTESWKKRRPKSTYLNYLVTDHADSVEPFYRSELPGISAVEKPLVGPAGNPRSFKEIQVPTNTLTRILDEVLAQPFDGLIVGHGTPIATGGRDALAAAYAWL